MAESSRCYLDPWKQFLVLMVVIANTLMASTGAAGGRVVCFGLDGHIGIASQGSAEACCDDELDLASAQINSLAAPGQCSCIDVMIPHGARTLAARSITAPSHDLQVPAAPAADCDTFQMQLWGRMDRNESWPPDSSCRAALRAIVLLV